MEINSNLVFCFQMTNFTFQENFKMNYSSVIEKDKEYYLNYIFSLTTLSLIRPIHNFETWFFFFPCIDCLLSFKQ